ncbi:MAG: hypothetical protein IAC69_00925 [Proteobacteria bacterium]|uniref:Uncharacterized protein n=1 Tax=Candidatus Enterousia avistercoris TaxID=2840788 RepID=A0A9D9DEW9_9PROT|nr:hypothetical protein [Candidatus Enterousia avistercoris]
MADVKMGDFLLQYYMQRRFNTMPAVVRAQFDAYAKSDDFRGNMKDWKKKLMHTDADGKLVENTMPYSAAPGTTPHPDDTTGNMTMTDDEWEKLFKAFQDAFRKMSANADSFKDNAKATSFLNEHFGNPSTHLFSNSVADPITAEPLIQGVFKQFLENYKNSLEIYFKQWGLTDSDFSYSDLISGIKSKKYNTDPAFQDKVKTVAQYINFYGNQADFRDSLGMAPGATVPDFSNVEKGFDTGAVDPAKLDYFKRNYKDFLNTLATESKVYDVFKQYDKGKISTQLDAANGNVDYANKDSKDYVPPKRDDELTPWQHLKENVSDTWSDYMDKYTKLTGDRVYFSNSAKLIFKALTGAKFNPTDGLGKLMDSAGDIKKNLMYKSPRAVEHFEWMEKTLGDLKNTMPKAFAGALKNGGQMRALVSELILNAVRDNKIDEAKTAMEVLSVVKYGYTTSKIMDTLRADKNLFTIFSDGGLSWNKNEGVKFVTNAMDKTVRFAFLTAGYAITGIGNAIRLNGSKFNGKTGRMKKAHDAWVAQNDAARTAAETRRTTENATDTAKKAPFESTLSTLDAAGINAGNIDQKRTDLQNLKTDAEQKQNVFNAAQKQHDDAQDLIDQDSQYAADLTRLQNANFALNNAITAIDAQLNNPQTFAGMPDATANALANSLMMQRMQAEQQIQQNNAEIQTTTQKRAQIPAADLANARANIAQYQTDMQNAQNIYNAAQSNVDDLNTNINDFDNATARIKELDESIKKRNDTVKNWDKDHQDKYKELMAYWDMLETGRDSHTGKFYSWMPGSAKKKQGRFDKMENMRDASGALIIDPTTGRPKQDMHKNILFQKYLDNYSMVA